jgi:hypothetical protein
VKRNLTLAVCGILLTTCGAEDKEAPAAEKVASFRECNGFSFLAPSFAQAISSGRTENLKHVIETQLIKPLREGEDPPISNVMRAIFGTLTRLSQKPAEIGAPAGEYCAMKNPPPLASANEICEFRRGINVAVHQGKAIDAINLIDPQISIFLNYITGKGNDCKGRPRTPHFELSAIVSNLCVQDTNCQINDGLDLAIGFSAYTRTAAGSKFATDLEALADRPNISGLLDPTKLSENDAVAIVKALLPAITGTDAVGLQNAFNNLPLSQPVKDDLKPVIDDLKVLLGHPEIINPVKRAINCVTIKDKNFDLVRTIYRLSIEEQCSAFGLTAITKAAKQLRTIDNDRGSQAFLIQTLAQSIRADEIATSSAAQVCRTLFSNVPAAGETRSNAQLIIPVVAELVEKGIVKEIIKVTDVLLCGCASGPGAQCN